MARSTSTSQARTSTTVARKAAVKPPAEASTKAKTMAAGKRSAPAAKPAATVAAPKVGKATSVAKAARPAKPAPSAPAEAVRPVSEKAAALPSKAPKLKLVRDSFTMPEDDYATIAAMKQRAIGFQRPARKSELLRAGLRALAALDDAGLKAALDSLVPVKAGRPKKH